MAQHWGKISILQETEADVDSGALQPHSEALTHPTASSTPHLGLFLLPLSWARLIPDRWASGQLQPKQNKATHPRPQECRLQGMQKLSNIPQPSLCFLSLTHGLSPCS